MYAKTRRRRMMRTVMRAARRNKMQIYDKRLDEIKPYENNPRHNDNAVDAVAKYSYADMGTMAV